MSPDSKSPNNEKVLVLRGRHEFEGYLGSFPAPPPTSVGGLWVDAEAWVGSSPFAEQSTWALARRWDLPAIAVLDFEPTPEVLAQFGPEAARRLRALPLVMHKGLIAVAMEDAGNREAIDQLNFLSHNRVVPIAASAQLIREGIGKLYDRTEDMAIAYTLGLDPHATVVDSSEREVERLSREQPVVSLVATLISNAVRRRASDIHLRPGEHGADILYRIDDEMVPVRRLIHALQPAVVSRIKVLANMNLAEHRKAAGRPDHLRTRRRPQGGPAHLGAAGGVRRERGGPPARQRRGALEPRTTRPDPGRPAAP